MKVNPGSEDKLALCPKSQGRGLIVGNFTDDHEHSGYLYLSIEEQEVAKVSHPDLPYISCQNKF